MRVSNSRVLVTGGAGFIGAHACKALAEAGALPVAYDNLSTGHQDAVHWGPLVRGDVRDRGALSSALKQFRIDTILHFAASAYVGESVADPALYYDNNVSGMVALLDAARDAGVSQIVFSSSCATYGVPELLPISEYTPQAPINPYGRTKLICEQMLKDYGAAYGIRHVALRYFNAAGADPSGVIGERHEPETHLLPLALRAAAGGQPLNIFGADYDTPDGTCIRDYVHVSDLARGHLLALAYLHAGGKSTALNLGSGRGHSVLEICAAVERVTGRAVPLQFGPRRAGDPPVLTADPALAARVLGFRTRLSDIDTIVSHAAPWFGLSNHRVKVA
ncbi:UDP-glucose 4-epimerase GalE [Frigidibacter sp. RF13]|uniref:UDP-glucose 4-epimerase GalE n=1 Tax=Frigidibacter sp. RF13 TaxID=2997340 RepID=UPI00226FA340|nr:UDP-glucose 4-epimerase GalE [Frigidibacter sp. RF13]MCY1128501.1 UDP-glucose 4-epimerase GalE [Frigidibacter sp. RF13]